MSSLKIINISVYFAAADGEPAIIEVFIQVLRIGTIMLWSIIIT